MLPIGLHFFGSNLGTLEFHHVCRNWGGRQVSNWSGAGQRIDGLKDKRVKRLPRSTFAVVTI
jgi:hypothetical protein